MLLVIVNVHCDRAASERLPADVPAADVPVRPGSPEGDPFWNTHSGRFIYPPAFHIDEVDGAAKFRLDVRPQDDTTGILLASMRVDRPWRPLNDVWAALPDGKLTVEAVAVATDGSERPAGERAFIKSPDFSNAVYPPRDYRAAAVSALAALFQDNRLQTWLRIRGPNSDYPLWVHPTKLMGAVASSMATYSRFAPDSIESEQAITIARTAADFLLDMREPPDAPLANWPPTYWDGVPRGKHPIYMGQHMTHYHAEGAGALLDLFDATDDSTYFAAAVQIAETYQKLQRDDGTWFLLLRSSDGQPAKQNSLIPLSVIEFFDRLQQQYGVERFSDMRQRAFLWCMANPMKTYAWEAQYEDTRPKPTYRNLSYREASKMARLLFSEASEYPEYVDDAVELLRFVEDQFVVWDPTDAVLFTNWFKPGAVWNGNDPVTGKDWFLPVALEQYAFYTPIAGASAILIEAYVAGYEATGNEVYMDKAASLAYGLTEAQNFHGGGEIPTHLRRELPEANWINAGYYAVQTFLRHGDALQAWQKKQQRSAN